MSENVEPVTLASVEAAVARGLAEPTMRLPELTPAEIERLAQKVFELLRDDLRRSRERSVNVRW